MRLGLTSFVVSLLLAGCANGAGPLRPQSEPRPAVVSSSAAERAPSAASASGSASPTREPAPLPLPAAPPGSDPEKATFAASLCAAAYLGKNVGCRSHPPFVRPEQKPDGRFIEHKGDPLQFCDIDRIFHGSFTRPGAKQAIVSFAQCMDSQDSTWDSGFPGSAVLAEEIDGRWKAIGYEADVNLGLCLQGRRADGRDVLLCRSGLAAPPGGEVSYFFLLDFARAAAGKPSAASFAKVFGDVPTCTVADTGLPSGMVSLEVDGMKLTDLNHDGTDDLIVKIKRARLPASPALDAKLRASCKRGPSTLTTKALLPTPKASTLEFVSDGERFTPTRATRQLLETWKTESPADFNGLAGVGPPLLE